jgi:hypothetical protein
MKLPSLEYLRSRLTVDADSGIATWNSASKYHQNLVGKCAGSVCTNHYGKRYVHIKIDGQAIKRSHIVFLFSNGRWPNLQIDHINGDSLDDRIANLREATATQNAWNHKKRAKSSSTGMGVRTLPSGRFQARIACNKRSFSIGSFATEAEAVSAYKKARKEFFNDFA